MVVSYIRNLPTRSILWGPAGQLDYPDYLRVSPPSPTDLYKYATTTQSGDVLFFASLAVAVAFTLGVFPRFTSCLFVVSVYSGVQRIAIDFDGGRTLLILLAFLLCFADTSRYFVLFRLRAPRVLPFVAAIGNMLHNSAYFLITWQICMVYSWAVFYKLAGPSWRNGTAMYYVLKSEHFSLFSTMSGLVSDNAMVVAALTYFTLAFQMAFPFLMWNGRLKPYLVFVGVCLHVGIALTMGLVSFSVTMIAADISLLSDKQLLATAKIGERFKMRFPRFAPPIELSTQRGNRKLVT